MKRKNILFTVKDYLVSGESFQVIWDEKRQRGKTLISSQIDLSKYYSSQAYVSHKESKNGLIDELYFAVQKMMFHYKANLINRYARGKKLLDYGSGIGKFGKYMTNLNYDVSLLEPDNKARAYAKKQGLRSYRFIEELRDCKKFNLISLWHVLEHLKDPEKVLFNLDELLTNEGKIFIAVPNLRSYDARFYKSYWAALDVPRHLWHFTTPSLKIMLKPLGYRLKAKHALWFDSLYISYLSEKHLKRRWPLFRGILMGLISNISGFFSGEYSSLIYVFEKTSSLSED